MKFFLVLLTFLAIGLEAPAATRKYAPKQVTAEEVVKSGGTVRTAQQDAELKDWIIGIQKLAQEAREEADKAEAEAAQGRKDLTLAAEALVEANVRADSLQKAVDAQTSQLNKALEKNAALEKKVEEQGRHINTLKTLIGVVGAAALALLMLWLKVPSLFPPYGAFATAAIPVLAFALVKLLF